MANPIRRQHSFQIVLIGACLSGCTPTVEPVGFAVDSVDWHRVEAHFDLRADNPWPVDITVQSVHYAVSVEGNVVATGDISTPQTVPARGTHAVPLPLRVDTRSTLAALTAPAEGPTTGAVITGAITFDTPLGPVEVPVTHEETVPVLQEPTLQKPWVELRDVSFRTGTIDLVLGFTVYNPNALALDVRRLAYNVTFSGATLVKGSKKRVQLAAEDTTRLEFPVHIDAAGLGRGVVQALRDGQFKGSARLQGRVQTPWDPIELDLQRTGKVRVWD